MTSVMMFLSFITLTAQSTEFTAALDKIYSSKFPANGPGCAVLVARGGEVIYRKAFGMADLELKVAMVSENVFRIASLTKQFTAVAILQLHEKGLLNIEDDIKKYIPDFPSTEKITIAVHSTARYWSDMDPMMPSRNPPTTAPLRLPMPPSTAAVDA